jgi:hypothetical protein
MLPRGRGAGPTCSREHRLRTCGTIADSSGSVQGKASGHDEEEPEIRPASETTTPKWTHQDRFLCPVSARELPRPGNFSAHIKRRTRVGYKAPSLVRDPQTGYDPRHSLQLLGTEHVSNMRRKPCGAW